MRSSLKNTLFPQQNIDLLVMYLLRIIAAFVGVIVVFILVFLMMESMPVLNQVGLLAFLTNDSWNPGDKLYNLTPMLVSTVFVVAGAVVVATPLGILSALFCHYYAPEKIAHFYRRLMELLAGVPGVVYGFWGLMVLIPLINRWHPPGSSLLAGILMLTLLIMPTIALIADASFAGIADEYLHGAISLGLTRSGTIFSLILPIARSELLMGIILATGRALGETMIVLMVCGNIVQIPDSLFAPIRTLPANIALEMDFALGNHRSALFVSGLLLMAISLVLVLLAEAIKDN